MVPVACLRIRSRAPLPLILDLARSFSSSLPRRSHVLFRETDNTELSQQLQEVLTKVIIPAKLSPEQKTVLFNPSSGDRLKAAPIRVEIEGAEFTYNQPIDRSEWDLRSNHVIVRRVVPLMKTGKDWSNLPILMAGLRKARKSDWWADSVWMAREASAAGQLPVVMRCIEQADQTGWYLGNTRLVVQLLTVILQDAIASGYDKAAIEKALRQAERVLELLEDPKQKAVIEAGDSISDKVARRLEQMDEPSPTSAQQNTTDVHIPLHRDPLILAHVLNLAAIRAIRHQDGQDGDGKVEKYARLVTRVWPADKTPLNLYPAIRYKVNRDYRFLTGAGTTYFNAVFPALNGLESAAQLVDPELAAHLGAIAEATRAEVKTNEEQNRLAYFGRRLGDDLRSSTLRDQAT